MSNQIISVCVPTYNRGHYLAECIESIIAQDYKMWELIIQDDGSTDGTDKLMAYYVKKDKRIKYFKNKSNKGIAFTRNEAIGHSNGDYIAVMDSDDLMNPERLSLSLKAIKDVDFVYGAYWRADEDAIVKDGVLPPEKLTKKDFYNNGAAPHVTIMAKKKCFIDNPYRNECTVNDDSLLLCDWYKAGYTSKMINKPLVIVRFHDQSVSETRKKEVDKWTKIMRKELDEIE